jgi:hypothetical protein
MVSPFPVNRGKRKNAIKNSWESRIKAMAVEKLDAQGYDQSYNQSN